MKQTEPIQYLALNIYFSGTQVFYQPGMLIGGSVTHDCSPQRGIGYFIEGLLCLAPFMKTPLRAVLKGVTNNQNDPSVDMIKLSCFPVAKKFLGTDEGLDLKVVRRGAAPGGGGEVLFTCPTRQKLRPLQVRLDFILQLIASSYFFCIQT